MRLFPLSLLACIPITALLVGCPCTPGGGPAPTTLQQLVDQEVGSVVDSRKAVGIAAAVIRGDQVSRFYYGETVKGSGKAPDANTEFEIGSVTKTFTSALFGLMLADGVVTLDTPLQDLLPSSVHVPEYQGQKILLRHLASHLSGLPTVPTNMDFVPLKDPYRDYTLENLYDFLGGYTLTRAPGSAYEYSNMGMSLLGIALSLKAGLPYEQLVEDRVLTPLGLADTVFNLSDAQHARLAAPYRESLLADYACVPPVAWSEWHIGPFAPAGALHSTLEDFVRYAQANLHATENALAPAADLLYTPRFTVSDQIEVALGWHHVHTPTGLDVVFHDGETGSYCSFLGFVPATGEAVVLLANTSAAVFTDGAGFHVLDGLHALPQ